MIYRKFLLLLFVIFFVVGCSQTPNIVESPASQIMEERSVPAPYRGQKLERDDIQATRRYDYPVEEYRSKKQVEDERKSFNAYEKKKILEKERTIMGNK